MRLFRELSSILLESPRRGPSRPGRLLKNSSSSGGAEAHIPLPLPDTAPEKALRRLRSSQKKREPAVRRARILSLEGGDVRSLQALGALGYFEFNRLAFVQR